jgi:hypothetical protein
MTATVAEAPAHRHCSCGSPLVTQPPDGVRLRQCRPSLPHPLDDLTADFGSDIYDRMAYDPQIAACLTVLKASILEDGLTLSPAVDDKLDPRYPLAVEIKEAAEAMLDDLETPLDDALLDMLHAIAVGNRVAELKYEVKPGPTAAT